MRGLPTTASVGTRNRPADVVTPVNTPELLRFRPAQVLRNMRRGYTVETYMRIINRIREVRAST